MTDYREVLKQALEWIEAQKHPRMIGAAKTITAIKAALAEQPQQDDQSRFQTDSKVDFPFAFYDPVYRRTIHNPHFSMTVTPTTAWQREIPLYLHPPKQKEE